MTGGACHPTRSSYATSRSNVKHIGISGVQQLNNNSIINIYPNPTNGKFTIEMNDLLKQVQHDVSIYNVIGEKVFQFEINNPKFEIDISKQPAGVYLLKLQTEQGIVTKKLIINK